MIPLALFILLGLTILVLFEWRVRHQKKQREEEGQTEAERQEQNAQVECCGQHLVCEREIPLMEKPEYYDDEELDSLAGIPAARYTAQQEALIREIFVTLPENDVIGWVRSLQMRRIELPADIRDEALLIVRERRVTTAKSPATI